MSLTIGPSSSSLGWPEIRPVVLSFVAICEQIGGIRISKCIAVLVAPKLPQTATSVGAAAKVSEMW